MDYPIFNNIIMKFSFVFFKIESRIIFQIIIIFKISFYYITFVTEWDMEMFDMIIDAVGDDLERGTLPLYT